MSRLAASLLLLVAGCGSAEKAECSPHTNQGCLPTEQCEAVSGSVAACFPAVVVAGNLVDTQATRPVRGARVLVVDDQGVPIAAAGASDDAGAFAVRVPTPRDATGKPQARPIGLRVEGKGFQTFPSLFRAGVAANLGTANLEGGQWVVTTGTIELIGYPGLGGQGSIAGTVQAPAMPGRVLVTAELADGRGAASVADAGGAFLINGLLPGEYTVRAYARGMIYGAIPVVLNAGEDTVGRDVKVDTSSAGVTVTFSLSLLDASRAFVVDLVPLPAWDPVVPRGDLAPGLELAALGGGNFTLGGVPPGRYYIVPSIANDGLARRVESPLDVLEVGTGDLLAPPQTLGPALTIVGPGSDGPVVASTPPLLQWQPVAGARQYEVTVVSSSGLEVFRRSVGSEESSVRYDGPLVPGTYYFLRVLARGAEGTLRASSEELRGIFYGARQ